VILVTGAAGNAGAEVAPTTTSLLGRPPRTFRDWARAHAGDFTG
jgi:hypothetical protein